MGWIRYPNATGLQAIHKAEGREIARRYFSFKRYVTPENAERVARRWLRYCATVRPWTLRITHKSQANKTQPYPRGVSLKIQPRRGRDYNEVYMQVYWHDGNKSRNKSFYVGNEDIVTEPELKVAERAAIAFRQAYVAHKTNGEPFNPADWDNWRDVYALPNT